MPPSIISGKLQGNEVVTRLLKGMFTTYCGQVYEQDANSIIGNFSNGQQVLDKRIAYANTNPFNNAVQMSRLLEYANELKPELVLEVSQMNNSEFGSDNWERDFRNLIYSDESNNIFNAEYQQQSYNIIGFNTGLSVYDILAGVNGDDRN